MAIDKNRHRKRIPVVLAGSSLTRGLHKSPQAPPKSKPQKKLAIVLPSCPHGVQLTEREWNSQAPAGQMRLVQAEKDGPIVQAPLDAWACVKCHPFCSHGVAIDEPQLEAGEKKAMKCPACNPEIQGLDFWEPFLKRGGLSEHRGMGLAKVVHNLADGTAIIMGGGKNNVTGGGSKDMEDRDHKSANRGDMQARAKGPKGWDSGTYVDEQNSVSELNEPVSSVPSGTIKKAESIRSSDTRSTIEGQLIDPEKETKGAKKLLKLEVVREDGRDDLTVPECDKGTSTLKGNDKRLLKDILEDFRKNEIPVGAKEE